MRDTFTLWLSLLPLQLLLFALNEPLSGSAMNANYPTLPSSLPPAPHLNTTLRADLACQLDARRLGLHGTYIAVLSAPQRSLYNIIPAHYTSLPVVNIKVKMNIYFITFVHYHKSQGAFSGHLTISKATKPS